MQQIHESLTLAEAHLIRGVLEAEGIAVEIRGEHLTFGEGHRSPAAELRPSVWVNAADVPRAREVLAATSGPAPPAAAEVSADATGEVPVAGEEAQAAMSEVFLVVGSLRRAPRQGDLYDELRRLRPAVADSPPPYGIPGPIWDTLARSTADIITASEADDGEAVAQLAADLHTLLREYV